MIIERYKQNKNCYYILYLSTQTYIFNIFISSISSLLPILHNLFQSQLHFLYGLSRSLMWVSSHIKLQKPMRKLIKYCQVRNTLLLLTIFITNKYFSFYTNLQQSSWKGSLPPTKIFVRGYFLRVYGFTVIGETNGSVSGLKFEFFR